jgi:phosphatidylglycerol:prolipoprotein diacylglycerol transferase
MPKPAILAALPFPEIDPILIQFGPFAIRWYALAYIGGLLLGWRYMRKLSPGLGGKVSSAAVDDFLIWATIGVVLGGRLGYVLFYQPAYFAARPLEIFYVWQGGMSFHGGLLGVLLASVIFARKQGIPFLALADLLALVAPIGLFFGRIANFINGELWGRPADVPWAIVFPRAGAEPRHPSQLYEALLEGLFLLLLLAALYRYWPKARREGVLGGAFLAGYGLARIFVEFFREPDAYLGLIAFGLSLGQILSAPMVLGGLWLVWRGAR